MAAPPPEKKKNKSKSSGGPRLPPMIRLSVAAFGGVVDASCRRDGTLNRSLFDFFDLKSKPSLRPVAGVRSADIIIDGDINLWARVFAPAAAAGDLPVVVYFHGGGFTFFSPKSRYYHNLCRRISGEIPAVIVSVGYRCAPEHKYPTAYDDGVRALAFLDSGGLDGHAVLGENTKLDLSRCFLAGDSAGANIAHHVARRWLQYAAAGGEEKRVKLAGTVSIQAFFGGVEKTPAEEEDGFVVTARRIDFSWQAYLPAGAGRDHPAVNVAGDEALEEGFPPTMVVVGGFDPLRDCQRRYYEMLKRKGKEAKLVEYPEAFHGFIVFPELPDSGKMLQEMRGFMGVA